MADTLLELVLSDGRPATLLVGEAADIALLAKMPLEKLAELITAVVERAIKPGPEGKNSPGPADKSSQS